MVLVIAYQSCRWKRSLRLKKSHRPKWKNAFGDAFAIFLRALQFATLYLVNKWSNLEEFWAILGRQ